MDDLGGFNPLFLETSPCFYILRSFGFIRCVWHATVFSRLQRIMVVLDGVAATNLCSLLNISVPEVRSTRGVGFQKCCETKRQPKQVKVEKNIWNIFMYRALYLQCWVHVVYAVCRMPSDSKPSWASIGSHASQRCISAWRCMVLGKVAAGEERAESWKLNDWRIQWLNSGCHMCSEVCTRFCMFLQ